MLILVDAILGGCCIQWMLYLVDAVLGGCYTWWMLYWVYAVLDGCCTRCMLYSELTCDHRMERWRGMSSLWVL